MMRSVDRLCCYGTMQREAREAGAGTWTAEPEAGDLCDLDGRLRWKVAGHVLFYGTFGWATALAAPEAFAASTGSALLGAGALLVAWYTYWAVRRERRPEGSLAVRAVGVAVTSALWVLLMAADPSYSLVGIGVLAQVYGSLPWRMSLPGGVVVIGIMSAPGFFDGNGFQRGDIVGALFGVGLMLMGSLSLRAMAVESARRRRLIEELQATREELARAERRAGMVDERQRLAAELHDTLTQGFTSIVMLLEATQHALDTNEAKAARHVESALGVARESLVEVRSLVWALRPEVLEHQTLAEALERVTSRLEEQGRGQVDTRMVVTGAERRLPAEVELTLLRAGQEALTNVHRHARAGRVTVTLSYMEDVVTLDVQDDGSGFDAQQPFSDSGRSGGLGLVSMRERVEDLGGALNLESAPGEGTCVALRLLAELPSQTAGVNKLEPVAP